MMMRQLMILTAGLSGLTLAACSGSDTANNSAAANSLTDGSLINRTDDASAGMNATAPITGGGTTMGDGSGNAMGGGAAGGGAAGAGAGGGGTTTGGATGGGATGGTS